MNQPSGQYLIVPPGGPAGPFWGIVQAPQGRVIAMQIPDEADAKAIVEGLKLLSASPAGPKAIIADFYRQVCERAETNMAATNTVAGAHWNAMIQVMRSMGIEVSK